jgi:hypothetical protein
MATASDSVKSVAHGVLGKLAAHDGVKVDDGDRNVGPAELLGGPQSALAGDQRAVWADDDGVQHPKVRHGGGKRGEVAKLAADALTDDDRVDAAPNHGTALVERAPNR